MLPANTEEEHYGIKILKNGDWLYQGTPIKRHNLVKLFASALKRDDKGDYWLITPAERGRIEVEDAPFLAVEMLAQGKDKDQVLRFRTNMDEWVEANAQHPLRITNDPINGELSPYVMARDKMEARIVRSVYYDLMKLAIEKNDVFGIWSNGVFFAVPHE